MSSDLQNMLRPTSELRAGFEPQEADTQVDGLVDQATGVVKEAYGKTIDAATEGAQTVKDTAIAGHDYVRKFMEDNPHTTTLIALGIGLLIGYAAHRPPPRRNWWG
jgi:ElaB/YqjD/DUF883 family membrane-anchored ribosome-binding protein